MAASWTDAKRRDEMVMAFQTTNTVKKYKDQLGILNTSFSSVGTGHSLNPANLLISLDNIWLPSTHRQIVGRVSRLNKV